MTKQIVLMGTAVMTTLLALFLLWQVRLVVVYVLLSLALAAALRPLFKRPVGQPLASASGSDYALPGRAGQGSVSCCLPVVEPQLRDIQELAQLAAPAEAMQTWCTPWRRTRGGCRRGYREAFAARIAGYAAAPHLANSLPFLSVIRRRVCPVNRIGFYAGGI
jgi:RimJ/RimL family protein N-acetyltransferase